MLKFLFFFLGSAIEDSLKELAERRTDIFGVGDEETVIGKKIGEEDTKKDDKVCEQLFFNETGKNQCLFLYSLL